MITLNGAIVILADIPRYVKPGDPPEEHDAIRLGIEALRAIQRHQRGGRVTQIPLLPGEEKD